MIEGKIGDYTITDSLGKGGFGSVWKARSGDGRQVALKVLNPHALKSERVVKKFFNEAMILAKLDHPHICKLHEFFPNGDNFCIVMEFIEGTDLRTILKQIRVPFGLAHKIARQALSGFQYAHENRILHRDIKPGNIMVDTGSNCKIMDFGIAKISSTASHDTAAGMLSVHYVPPERFDRNRDIDVRSDIYSLGLVFYEMFAGRRPFQASETSQIMYAHLNEVPEPPAAYAKRLPDNINRAILRALEKDPQDRFADFRQFAEALNLDGGSAAWETEGAEATGEIRFPDLPAQDTAKTREDVCGRDGVLDLTPPAGFFSDTDFPVHRLLSNRQVGHDVLLGAFQTYRDHLEGEYRSVSRRAETLYRLWVGCAAVGGVVFITGIIAMLYSGLLKGSAIVCSTVIVFFVLRLFQKREDDYRRQAMDKHALLSYGNHWLLVIRSIEAIPDPAEKRKQQIKLVDALTDRFNPPAPGQAPRHPNTEAQTP